MATHVAGEPYRYKHGWIKLGADVKKPAYPEIGKADLSNPGTPRTRAVSPSQFQRIAARGAAQYQKLKRNKSATIFETGSPAQRAQIMNRAYTETRDPWGGATIDAHTGEFVGQGADKYALSVREPGMGSVSVSPNASPAEFRAAFTEATTKYRDILSRQDHHLGVFHDADKNTIDIDPVLVTGHKEHTETIGAYTHAVGGAYHFKSGDGFWPPYVERVAHG